MSWLSFRDAAPCSLSLNEFGTRKDPGLTWKVQMCAGDEAEKMLEDPCPVPTLKLFLQKEHKKDPGKGRVEGPAGGRQ